MPRCNGNPSRPPRLARRSIAAPGSFLAPVQQVSTLRDLEGGHASSVTAWCRTGKGRLSYQANWLASSSPGRVDQRHTPCGFDRRAQGLFGGPCISRRVSWVPSSMRSSSALFPEGLTSLGQFWLAVAGRVFFMLLSWKRTRSESCWNSRGSVGLESRIRGPRHCCRMDRKTGPYHLHILIRM